MRLRVLSLAAAALVVRAGGPGPLPRPSSAQLSFVLDGPTQFMHFGMCTYHNCQQNSPFFPAASFNLTQDADTDQWVRVAKSWGAKRICLTVHHTGGFALWPTNVTLPGGAPYAYSVAASPYQGGRGDIVRQFVDSCRADGEVDPCFYIIPSWDNYVTTEAPNATSDEYLQVQLDMLTELLSNYGPIPRLWFDKCVRRRRVQRAGAARTALRASSLRHPSRTLSLSPGPRSRPFLAQLHAPGVLLPAEPEHPAGLRPARPGGHVAAHPGPRAADLAQHAHAARPGRLPESGRGRRRRVPDL